MWEDKIESPRTKKGDEEGGKREMERTRKNRTQKSLLHPEPRLLQSPGD